jgi:stage III sporulation protein AA
MMLIRSMSPQVLICDEIGQSADAVALAEAANAGIAVITSAHAATEKELLARPVLAGLLANGAFERVALLSRRQGPGTLEKLLDGALQPLALCGHPQAALREASC